MEIKQEEKNKIKSKVSNITETLRKFITPKKLDEKTDKILIGQAVINKKVKPSFRIVKKSRFDPGYEAEKIKSMKEVDKVPVIFIDIEGERFFTKGIRIDDKVVKFFCKGKIWIYKAGATVPLNYDDSFREYGYIFYELLTESINQKIILPRDIIMECRKVNHALELIMTDFFARAFANLDDDTSKIMKYAFIGGLLGGVGIGFIIKSFLK